LPGARVAAAAALLAACAGPAAVAPPPERFEYERPELGTLFRLVLYAPDRATADAAAEAAWARIGELDRALSDYDPESELERLSARAGSGPVPVSADLWAVLERARSVSIASDGAFDVTVGPLVRLWRRAARQRELPAAEQLASAHAAVGHALVRLDPDVRTAELLHGGMRLDLGGIAKGFVLDEVLRTLARHGVEVALVDGGGDVACSAPPPGRGGWRVRVVPGRGAPEAELELAHAAVATSGDAERGFEIEGRRYSHVIDPRTGAALTSGVAATVIAADGMSADAWASALCVLGAAGLARLEPGLEARVVTPGADPPACETAGFGARMPR
jgi:thiamine biosynthesis lipoprotein